MAFSSLSSMMLMSPTFSSSNSSLFNNTTNTNTTFKSLNLVLHRSVGTSNNNNNKRGLRSCKCMFGLGVPELVVIAGVATLVFGPKMIPEVGRSIGKTFKSFQQAAKEFETELKKEDPESFEDPKIAVNEIIIQQDVKSTHVSL